MGGITTTIGKVKYIGIASLTIAILSILILNIISSYSSSNIESNAIDSNSVPSTLANDSSICDPTNTNAASCISLSISSSSSSSTDSNNPNLSLQIPREGGVAVGRHTVSVSSNNVTGYYVSLNAKSDTTDLVNTNDDGTVNKDHVITSLPVGNDFLHPTVLSNNTWGVALPGQTKLDCVNSDNCSGTRLGNSSESDDSDGSDDDDNPPDLSGNYEYWFSADYYYDDEDYFDQVLFASIPPRAGFTTNVIGTQNQPSQYNHNIYYGVRVDNPNELLAGSYQAEVVYTATTNEVPMPTITSTSSNTYELGSGADSTVTIAGTNLASTYKVYIESNTDSTKQYDITSTITNLTDTGLTVTIPTDQTNPDLEPGDYTIHVVTQGGEGSVGFSYTKKTLPDGILESTDDYGEDGHVAVDYDENMIPVTYIGNETTPRWVIADPSNDNANDSLNWYNYPAKKWANAVTLTEEGLAKYKGQSVGTEIDEQYVLGYWVYIPRYAYEVMRRDATDRVVVAQNFEIKFETASDVKKTPKGCTINSGIKTAAQMWKDEKPTSNADPSNTNILAVDYRTGCYIDRTYPGNDKTMADQTTWATHPAFTWQYTKEINGFDKTYELNGFWIGKFETTEGWNTDMTVLPNKEPNYLSRYADIGGFYSSAANIGVKDVHNTYSGGNNSHNLKIAPSHLLKNTEWGATSYLSASKYGTGVGNIKINSNYVQMEGYTITISGCGPSSATSLSTYTANSNNTGTYRACGNDVNKSYIGSLGMMASTTGNVYGVYDMRGGNYEVVSASIARRDGESYDYGVLTPYVDLYSPSDGFNSTPAWSVSHQYYYSNYDVCTWSSCGGQGVSETTVSQSISDRSQAWNNEGTDFVYMPYGQTQLGRGGSYDGGSRTGLFEVVQAMDGITYTDVTFRTGIIMVDHTTNK